MWVVPFGGGGGALCTVNPDAVRLGPFGQLTVIVLVPAAADDAIVIPAVIVEAELKAQEFTVIPVPKLQIAPAWKLAPEIDTFRFCPCMPLLGDIPLIVGVGVTVATVNALV
jgi:hypothetical protein